MILPTEIEVNESDVERLKFASLECNLKKSLLLYDLKLAISTDELNVYLYTLVAKLWIIFSDILTVLRNLNRCQSNFFKGL